MKIYGGIDPGIKGAIVIMKVNGNEIKEVETYTIPLIKNEIDLNKLSELYLKIVSYSKDIFFTIEDVHSIFGASSKSTFSFGRGVGQHEMALALFQIPNIKIQPKEWQKEMFKGVKEIRKPSKSFKRLNKKTNVLETIVKKGNKDTKAMAKIAAKRLFPNVNLIPKRARTEHDGIIDALLICEYGRRKF